MNDNAFLAVFLKDLAPHVGMPEWKVVVVTHKLCYAADQLMWCLESRGEYSNTPRTAWLTYHGTACIVKDHLMEWLEKRGYDIVRSPANRTRFTVYGCCENVPSDSVAGWILASERTLDDFGDYRAALIAGCRAVLKEGENNK